MGRIFDNILFERYVAQGHIERQTWAASFLQKLICRSSNYVSVVERNKRVQRITDFEIDENTDTVGRYAGLKLSDDPVAT